MGRTSKMTLFVSLTMFMSSVVVVLYLRVNLDDHFKPTKIKVMDDGRGNIIRQIKSVDNSTTFMIGQDVPNWPAARHNLTTGKMKDKRPKPRHKVIILTYMRSGSTLTGDIVQQPQNVFYVFEPLWMTEKIFKGARSKHGYTLVDNSYLSVPKTLSQLNSRYTQVLEAILNCRMQDLDVATLMQPFMDRSYTTRGFLKCAGNGMNLTRLNSCLRLLNSKCLSSQVVAVKVIRISMALASLMMVNDPLLKILHLIRDPRGTLKSRNELQVFNWNALSEAALKLCLTIKADIEMSITLSEAFPSRILTVRYEDIADFPIEASEQIYTFLDLSLTSLIKYFIWYITYSGHPDGCKTCTNRGNASSTASHWRHNMTISSVNIIQQQCANVFYIMGYMVFSTQNDVKSLEAPSHYVSYSSDLLKVDVSDLNFKKKNN